MHKICNRDKILEQFLLLGAMQIRSLKDLMCFKLQANRLHTSVCLPKHFLIQLALLLYLIVRVTFAKIVKIEHAIHSSLARA